MKNKLCLVATVRAPEEQIINFINYHLNIGIDHLFLFFDNMSTKKILRIFSKKKVTIFECNDKYWEKFKMTASSPIEEKQRANANFALSLAKKIKFDWIIHQDIDELIYSKGDLKKYLLKVPKRIRFVRVPSLEAIPEKIDYVSFFTEVKLFKNNFYKLSKKFFRSPIAGKALTRVNREIINMRIHRPEYSRKMSLGKDYWISLDTIRLLHFNCCGFNDWRNRWKWRVDGTGKAAEGGKKYEKMTVEFRKISDEGEEKLKNLYKTQFFVSHKKKRIFKLIGLIRKIELNKDLFERRKCI